MKGNTSNKGMKTSIKNKEKIKAIKTQLLKKLKSMGMGINELESLEILCRLIIQSTVKQ
jgi:hypothetical protein